MAKKEVGGNILKLGWYIFCGVAIVFISIWSYRQTQDFFSPFDTDGSKVVSNSLAVLVTYGQNIVLFIASIEAGKRLAYKNKIKNISNSVHITILREEIQKSQTKSNIYLLLFAVFAFIDAFTNIGQFYLTTLVTAGEKFDGIIFYIFATVGTLIAIVVVFVEELFMDTVNSILHAFNDVLESFGKERFASFDLFIDPDKVIATRLGDGANSESKGNQHKGGDNRGQNNNNRNMRDVPPELRRSASANRSEEKHVEEKEPTYHPLNEDGETEESSSRVTNHKKHKTGFTREEIAQLSKLTQ